VPLRLPRLIATKAGSFVDLPARVVKVDVLQDKARQLGVSSEDIATTLNGVLAGSSITQVRDSIYLVNVMGRATAPERASIDPLRDLQLIGSGGQSVPLGAVATLRYEIEQPTIWRRWSSAACRRRSRRDLRALTLA
jgi:multidrug efflux pump subunit AcrB